MKTWELYIRTIPFRARRRRDLMMREYYWLRYCAFRSHRTKMDSHGHCINCWKKV